jgi:Gram-negative bacterial TonB protein C-terminal
MSWLRSSIFVAACVLLDAAAPGAPQGGPIPAGVILVKGAWSSAAGSSSALPEEGAVAQNEYDNAYFGLSYSFGPDWIQRYEGPPPSDGGYYVLAQMEPRDPSRNAELGHFLIAAQDLFFTSTPANSALQFLNYYRDHLGAEYRVERAPQKVLLAKREFVRLDYLSPASGLHWHVLATEIRCHVVEFVFTGSNARSLDRLTASVNTMLRQTGSAPVCVKDFANSDSVLEREDPVFTEPRFNQVPVRIVIDKQGKVKHVHFLSAFPEQAKSVADALSEWRFKPYLVNGQPVDVETGLVFGRAPRAGTAARH